MESAFSSSGFEDQIMAEAKNGAESEDFSTILDNMGKIFTS